MVKSKSKSFLNDPFGRSKGSLPDLNLDNIKIEHGKSLLKQRQSIASKYDALFSKLNVGDSFKFPIEYRDRFHHAAKKYIQRHGVDHEYVFRKISETEARCGRVK